MKGGVKLIGVKNMMNNLKSVGGNVQKSSVVAISKAGAHLERALKTKLSNLGTGKIYVRSNKYRGRRASVFHRASVPGQPPAKDTGRLMSSITHNVTGRPGNDLPDPGGTKDRVRGYVGTNMGDIGYSLERGAMIHPFGDPTRLVPLLPRPWMYPTFEEESKEVFDIVANTLKEAIEKAKVK